MLSDTHCLGFWRIQRGLGAVYAETVLSKHCKFWKDFRFCFFLFLFFETAVTSQLTFWLYAIMFSSKFKEKQ